MGKCRVYKVRAALAPEVRLALFARQAASGKSLHHEINQALGQAMAEDIARLSQDEDFKAGETLCTPPK